MATYALSLITNDREEAALAPELSARNISAEALFEETLRNLLSSLVGVARQSDTSKIVEALKTATDAEVEDAKSALNIQFQPKPKQ